MTTSHKISVMMYTGLVGVALLKGEDEFKTFEALESAGMIAILDEDEQKAYQVLKRNKLIQQPIIEKHGGKMLSYKDHRILSQFSSALDAVECADTIIRVCENEQDVKIRVGIHLGEFSFIDNEVSEGGLAFVSALETVAPVGCILASEPVHTNILNRKGIVSSIFESNVSTNVEADLTVFQVAVMGKDHILPDKPDLWHKLGTFVRQKSKVMIALTASLLIASYLLYSIYSSDQSSAPSITSIDKSIVVLPFVNISNDPEQEYFSDGVTEEILNHLSKIEELKVISRTTAMQYKGTTKSVNEITKELKVSTALEGSVRRSGNRIRITAQLVEGETDTHIWSETYDRELTDIFEVQSDVAQLIAQVLQADVVPETKQRIESQPTVNLEAYSLWLQGNFQFRFGEIENPAKELWERAVALDPGFAPAHGSLAAYWISLGSFAGEIATDDAVEKALYYLERALEADPEYGEAHLYKANLHLWYEWDFYNASIEIEKAIESGLTGVLARSVVDFYNATGNYKEAIKWSELLVAADVNNPDIWGNCGLGYYLSGQMDEGNAYYQTAFSLFPQNAERWNLDTEVGRAFIFAGEYDKVIEVLSGMLELSPNFRFPRVLSCLAIAEYHIGNSNESHELLDELETKANESRVGSPSFYSAMVYAQMGEIDTAFEWLEKAYQDHEVEMYWLKVEPPFDPLRDDPRWQEMLDKVGFPDDV